MFDAVARGDLVEGFDEDRERDRGIEVALRDVKTEAFGQEGEADHQKEGETQDDHGRVIVHECREGTASRHHDDHRDHDGRAHDAEVVDHAHRSDDGVYGEDGVKEENLGDDHPEARRTLALGFGVGKRFETFVEFRRRFEEKKDAAGEQNEVTPGKRMSEDRKDRRRERHEPGHDGKESEPHHEREPESGVERTVLLRGGELFGKDGDEYEIVNAEDDL